MQFGQNLCSYHRDIKAVNLGFIYVMKDSGDPKIPAGYKAPTLFRNHKFATTSTWEDSFFFTMVARKKLFMRQADVVTAYLNANMPHEVYVKLTYICETTLL